MSFSRTLPHASDDLEIKYAAAQFSRIDKRGVFTGYASLFDQVDLGQDSVAPGAFRKSLIARGASGVRMLFQHDPSHVLGVWLNLKEDAVGLHVRGRLTGGVSKADEVRALLETGALDGLSIGFKTIKSRKNTKSGVRVLTEIDLWEISVVTFPMLPEARVGVSVSQKWAGEKRRPPSSPISIAELSALQTRLKQATNLLSNKQVRS